MKKIKQVKFYSMSQLSNKKTVKEASDKIKIKHLRPCPALLQSVNEVLQTFIIEVIAK